MTYVVDIDGTICRTEKGDYKNSKPIKSRIDKLNKLYDKGNKIIYFTSRGVLTGKNWKELTKEQFKDWGVKYTKLVFGKPFGDVYLDDHSITLSKFFK